ncbi:dynamin-like protein [Dinothrombium tinctorium]|uniref:dynamin GTPase n=1 Tax=Dinothrombium tinctorium TaxID=1965070 RepID=A0A443QPQ8_9ACAR|nr:dynamin-like protein [Dinothrombium tinctorium]
MNAGNQGMQRLIEIINRVQDASSRVSKNGQSVLNLDLPQIAVVGGQSAGKSSVLENFVGRDFLPRGSGIVTRCPLILQLIHSSSEEYGVFLHNPTKKYFNFNEIRDEIERETDRKIGKNKNVSGDPINLRIYSPNVLDLTLIDLPGITRNPVGDQPKDIEQQIIKVVLDYISRDNCLILAVSAANQDIATSDALKLASQVDPEGIRTIGVLTKLDLMDQGTDAREILENRVLPLKRGYIGVVNRSQSDITSNKDIKSAIEAEAHFFKNHPSYKDLCNRLGTPFLQRTLNEQLTTHIQNSLPGLVHNLQHTLKDVKHELEKYKIEFGDHTSKTKVIFNALKEINNEFEMKIGLIVKSGKINLDVNKLTGGATINRIMNKRYRSAIQQMSLNDDEMRREISFAITNLRGVHIGLFTPDMAFDAVVRNQLARFEEPSNNCIDLVTTELQAIVKECLNKIKIYPNLINTVEKIVTDHIEKRQQKVKSKIKEKLEMEAAYMNTDHEDFIGLGGALKKLDERNQPSGGEGSEHMKPRPPLKPPKIQTTGNLQVYEVLTEVIHEGWLTIRGSRCFWFVLTDEWLSWFSKNDKKDRLMTVQISDGCHMDLELNQITLRFPPTKKPEKLELVFQTKDEFNTWLQAFKSVGISTSELISRTTSSPLKYESENGRGGFKNQVEVIRILVDSYLNIIKKNLQDMMPKLLMHGLINNTREFLVSDLHVALLSYDEDELLQVDPEKEKIRKELETKYDECKKALNIIRQIKNELNIN